MNIIPMIYAPLYACAMLAIGYLVVSYIFRRRNRFSEAETLPIIMVDIHSRSFYTIEL